MRQQMRPHGFAALAAVALSGALILSACTQAAPQPQKSAGAGPVAPVTVQQTSAPPKAPAAELVSAQPVAGFAAPSPGPNLLAKTWPERLGVIVSDMVPAKGKPILNPKPGDLWFFSNTSTTWGATNTKNAVWVIDAKTKKTVAEVAPFDGEGASSHGLAVSGDGRYIYLPMLGKDNRVNVMDGRTLEVVQTITTLGRPHHWKLWEDPNSKKALIIGEDFNWNFSGSGVYAFDPSQNNALVGGLSNGDFQGNPYVTTPSPDGSLIVVTVPAPTPALRDTMDGYVAKVNPKNWKVIGLTPMKDPIWAEVSLDNKYAYVTSGGDAKIYKINLGTMKIEHEVQTGPGPWGARLSYDGTKIYTADKGEGPGYNQQGHTSTIIDVETMGVVKVVNIGQTTDHAILSPDGKEVWFTSNAEHNIYVLDTATDEIKEVVKDPADGDIHGGVFVQYKDDGKGGVIGEVVADYSGLHASALAAQRQYASEPTLAIPIGRNGFLQKTLSVPSGQATRVIIKHVGGTSTGKVIFESKAMGIAPITLEPGESKEVRWTSPAQEGALKASVNKTPDDSLTLVVNKPAPKAAPGAQATGGPREIAVPGKNFLFNVESVAVKAGETVKFIITNADDEKHNLVGLGDAHLISPDVGANQKVTYQWTAPSMAGVYKVVCAYHPQMVFELKVQ